MHVGRKYTLKEYLLWTQREIGYLFLWSLAVTLFLQVSGWHFLFVPALLLTVVGSAVAIVLAFKNQQCYARIAEALTLCTTTNTNSLIWANKLITIVGDLDPIRTKPLVKEMFYRHFAWLTAMRFFLRGRKTWENTFEPGNAKFLAQLPTPESQSSLESELAAYLSEDELRQVLAHRGDKESLLLHWQYEALEAVRRDYRLSANIFVMLENALDELARLQGSMKRIKNYPYPRNYYSIAVILVLAFIAIVPFGFFSYAQDMGKADGLENWTVWLNVPFSIFIGWIFMTLEKVGENSSNPYEGGPNDVPISFMARRIEIEMRTMLGEQTDLKPIEPKYDIVF